jgi:hypothetical protein
VPGLCSDSDVTKVLVAASWQEWKPLWSKVEDIEECEWKSDATPRRAQGSSLRSRQDNVFTVFHLSALV